MRQSAIAFAELPATALQKSQQLVNLIVVRSQTASALDPLRGNIQFALAQRQHAPVRPASRLARHESGHFRKFALGVDIVADLQRAKSDVERGNRLRVFLRSFLGELRPGATCIQTNADRAAKKHSC